jgi:hypothetical protein
MHRFMLTEVTPILFWANSGTGSQAHGMAQVHGKAKPKKANCIIEAGARKSVKTS